MKASAALPIFTAGNVALAQVAGRKDDALSIRQKAARDGVPKNVAYQAKSAPDTTLRVSEYGKCLDRDLTGADPHLPLLQAFQALRQAMDKAYSEADIVDANHALENVASHIASQLKPKPPKPLRLTNPLGGLAFDLEGFDPPMAPMPPSPAFESSETAAEMAELYWTALLRDRSFAEFDHLTAANPDAPIPADLKIQDALNDLSRYSWFQQNATLLEPRAFWRARVPPGSYKNINDPKERARLSRLSFPGVGEGPYVSQFLLQGTDVTGDPSQSAKSGVLSFGPQRLSQQIIVAQPDKDYLADDATWKAVQGGDPSRIGQTSAGPQRFLTTLRDGASYVHFDEIYQEYLIAASILLRMVPQRGATRAIDDRAMQGRAVRNGSAAELPYVAEAGQSSSVLNCGNPYRYSKSQNGFATFGVTHILTLLAETSTRAHKAGWYHKWAQRRLRPEEYGARIAYIKSGTVAANCKEGVPYRIPCELLDSELLKVSFTRFGSYLHSQAFSEGCPTHPAYPSGHATIAGASVTILKAVFNETAMVASFAVGANNMLEPLGTNLAVGHELNKLASNILFFRGFAGVHWRSDSIEGALLGERVAIELLIEQTVRASARGNGEGTRFYRELMPNGSPAPKQSPFFRLTTFKGETIDITDGEIFKVTAKPGQDQETWTRANAPMADGYDGFVAAHYPELAT